MRTLHVRSAVALVLVLSGCSDAGRTRMNVLLVTLDTTRADYLGAYGRPGDWTPSFDRVARGGTRFDLAVATAAVTPVSHASILTGLDNGEHGLRVLYAAGGYRLPEDVPTLATVLKGEGYRTGAVHSAFPVSSFFGFQRGFDSFDSLEARFLPTGPEGSMRDWNFGRFQRRSDGATRRALGFLEQAPEPFFLWLHYWDPHDPLKRPPEGFASAPGQDDLRGDRALYAREVSYMDAQFGRILEALERSGSSERTMIVVVADHGQGLGDHGWAEHHILYQEQIRVPLIVDVPAHEQAPSVSGLVRTTDIAPTVLDYLGLDPLERSSGRSLRGLMEGRADEGRVAFADQINLFDLNAFLLDQRPDDDLLHCVMDDDWKLVYRPTRPELSELFHLSEDPREERNLLPRRSEQVIRLLRLLAEEAPWVTEPFGALPESPERELALNALAELGYAGGGDDAPSTGASELEWDWWCPDRRHGKRESRRDRCASCDSAMVPVLRRE